jgi:hypothetical protein
LDAASLRGLGRAVRCGVPVHVLMQKGVRNGPRTARTRSAKIRPVAPGLLKFWAPRCFQWVHLSRAAGHPTGTIPRDPYAPTPRRLPPTIAQSSPPFSPACKHRHQLGQIARTTWLQRHQCAKNGLSCPALHDGNAAAHKVATCGRGRTRVPGERPPVPPSDDHRLAPPHSTTRRA